MRWRIALPLRYLMFAAAPISAPDLFARGGLTEVVPSGQLDMEGEGSASQQGFLAGEREGLGTSSPRDGP